MLERGYKTNITLDIKPAEPTPYQVECWRKFWERLQVPIKQETPRCEREVNQEIKKSDTFIVSQLVKHTPAIEGGKIC